MARRFLAEALAFASMAFLSLATPSAKAQSGGQGVPSAQPLVVAPAATPTPPIEVRLPPAPQLDNVALPRPPASFCSEVDRVRFLSDVFNPAVNQSNANVDKANAHLGELSQLTTTATSGAVSDAARSAFRDYQSVSSQAYHVSYDVLAQRPAIMATPIVSCDAPSPPPVQETATSRPPPPPVRETVASQPSPRQEAREAVASRSAPPMAEL